MTEQPFYSQNAELSSCFHALPKSVQEGIMQSGVQFTSAEELKKFARHLTEKQS